MSAQKAAGRSDDAVVCVPQVLQEVLSRGGTVLVVAHRLKTVETAARIIFLENGEVMEEGTHAELLAKQGRYYDFSQSCD